MNKLTLSLMTVLLFATVAFAQGSKARTFKGEIMDSQCSMMGTHDPKGFQMTKTNNSKDCTLACAGMGGKFVLYDAAKKATYEIDGQDKAKEFAGQKVTVSGSYDSKTKTIHAASIKAT